MECNKFVEEKIGESDSPDFRAHLAGCAECARDLEELREVRALYRAASTEKYRGGIPRLRRYRMGWIPNEGTREEPGAIRSRPPGALGRRGPDPDRAR